MVEIVSNGMRCTVVETPKPGQPVQLSAGIMKLTAKEKELQLISAAPAQKKEKGSVRTQAPSQPTRGSSELDLRGMTAEEALMELDRFLDLAFRLRLPSATIIHGKGTGVLRQAVHSRLKGARQVKSFRLGAYGEGENGVTIVQMNI